MQAINSFLFEVTDLKPKRLDLSTVRFEAKKIQASFTAAFYNSNIDRTGQKTTVPTIDYKDREVN